MTKKHIFTSFIGKASTFLGGGFLLLSIGLVAIQWGIDSVVPEQLMINVPRVSNWNFMESHRAYMYLHIFTFVSVFSLSFDKNVHYYKKWSFLWLPTLLVGGFFIGWDVVFTAREVWGFNHDYVTGLFFLGLPVEEWLFFFTVPFACVFIYECLNFYIKRDLLKRVEPFITPTLIFVFLSIGLFFFWHQYTATTFLLAGGVLGGHYYLTDGRYRSRFYQAYLVSWIPFMLVNGVLTGGYTEQPIVQYNPEEYLGIRITSVPLDDSVYNFLLLLLIISGYERLKVGRW